MEKEQNDLFGRLTKNDLISIGILFHPDLMIKPHKPFVNVFDAHKLTPLLHKDVVESTAPAQQAPSKGCFYLFAAGPEGGPHGPEGG
jgi:hypothetical protein